MSRNLTEATRRIQFWLAVAAVALVLLGAFGPWVKGPLGISVSGTDGSNDGWLVAGAAAIAGICLLIYAQGRRKVALLIGLAASVASFGIALYDRHHVRHALANVPAAQVGWGLNLAMIASVGLALAFLALIGVRGGLSKEAIRGEPHH